MTCACGKPLHYRDPERQRQVEHFIAEFGEDVQLVVSGIIYRVPRHYIALHGIKGVDLPALAEQYGWDTAS